MKRLACWIVIGIWVTACGSNPNSPASVTPSAQGHWTGATTNQNCTALADFLTTGACVGFPATSSFDLILTQTGSTVSGTLLVGTFLFTVSGPVSASSAVSLTGRGTSTVFIGDLSNWSTQVSGTAMTGSFGYIITAPTVALGSVSVRAALVNVVKVS